MKYTVIYADPPWEYDNPKDHKAALGGTPYKQISLKELKELPIQQIAADDCALFMWATIPKLPEAIELMKAWGFKYTTGPFTWLKLNPTGELIVADKDYVLSNEITIKKGSIILNGGIYSGLGHWSNGNQEIIIMGKKGHPKRFAKNVKQPIVAPRSKHSRKPDDARQRIRLLMGDVPRIELFATETPEGWDVVGGAVDGLDISESLQKIIDKQT